MDSHFYTVEVKWNIGRKGIMCSSELNQEKENRNLKSNKKQK